MVYKVRFSEKVERLLDAFHFGEIGEDQLAVLIQLAIYDKIDFQQKVLFAQLTQINGKLELPPNS